MFVAIANTPRDYAWGSVTAIAELLGTPPTGKPQAELWLGAHPGSPSRIVGAGAGADAATDLATAAANDLATGGAADLAQWIQADPSAALGGRTRLPFLMKVLAAGAPLSLQAHPSPEQAIEGFERENALGIPLDAPNRNYRDAYPKPEVIYALSDTFDALCGFRPIAESREVFLALGLDELVPKLDSLPDLFAWLMSGSPEVDALVAQAIARTNLKENSDDRPGTATKGGPNGQSSFVLDALDTVTLLAQHYPCDVGILAALLLNRVTMTRGQALYLPAGNIHAYLRGVGIEIMTASDNVLRGGLTPKHVDVAELARVLDFTPGSPPWLAPEKGEGALEVFRPGNDDFVLAHATGDCVLALTGPAIALCVAGTMTIAGENSSMTLSGGDAAFVTADESTLAISGTGELFVGTTP